MNIYSLIPKQSLKNHQAEKDDSEIHGIMDDLLEMNATMKNMYMEMTIERLCGSLEDYLKFSVDEK